MQKQKLRDWHLDITIPAGINKKTVCGLKLLHVSPAHFLLVIVAMWHAQQQ
jgi:hypothetical protein